MWILIAWSNLTAASIRGVIFPRIPLARCSGGQSSSSSWLYLSASSQLLQLLNLQSVLSFFCLTGCSNLLWKLCRLLKPSNCLCWCEMSFCGDLIWLQSLVTVLFLFAENAELVQREYSLTAPLNFGFIWSLCPLKPCLPSSPRSSVPRTNSATRTSEKSSRSSPTPSGS